MSDDDYDDCERRPRDYLRARLERSLARMEEAIAADRSEERVEPRKQYAPQPCVACGRASDTGEMCFTCQQFEDMAMDDLGVRLNTHRDKPI